MRLDLSPLTKLPRVLIHAHLRPVAGTRIQPTGFPDLGAALYDDPNGTPTLLVESAQSMANRLEAVCWDDAADGLVPELAGLPYVRVRLAGVADGEQTTCSLLEFHRLNSPYIMNGTTSEGKNFADVLRPSLGMISQPKAKAAKGKGGTGDAEAAEDSDGEGEDSVGVVNPRKLASVCFKYDPNCLVHGVFLEKIAGRLRHPRALSAFIEATGVGRADSGGVKFDRALPNPKVAGVDAKGGYGNVPFHRTEFTAKSITAYFSIDLAQIRGYGLGEAATKFLITLSLWKIRRFLESSMRLRSACELELISAENAVEVVQPRSGFALPDSDDLAADLEQLLRACKPQFADPAVTELTWNK